MVAGKGDDVEGVLATVDGLEEGFERETLRVGLVQRELALLADTVFPVEQR